MTEFDNAEYRNAIAELAASSTDSAVSIALNNYVELLRRVQLLMAHDNMFIPTDSVRSIVLYGNDAGPERRLTYDDFILSARQYRENP